MNTHEYIDAIPESRKQRFVVILELIRKLYPDAEESMKYKMPTFTHGTSWISVANQKNYISLYTCSAEHIEGFRLKYPIIKTGKGCINFQDRDEIPLVNLQAVISSAMEQPSY